MDVKDEIERLLKEYRKLKEPWRFVVHQKKEKAEIPGRSTRASRLLRLPDPVRTHRRGFDHGVESASLLIFCKPRAG